jgi:hypothetical protein
MYKTKCDIHEDLGFFEPASVRKSCMATQEQKSNTFTIVFFAIFSA